MPFPASNLPTNAQPWGREVQKRIEATETALNRATINNDARDNQLAALLNRVNANVNSIITTEEAVFVPGTTQINGGNIAANTIAANKISAGDLIGFNIKTDTTGQRVELNGINDDIRFYNSSNELSGSISGASGGPSAPLIDVSGLLRTSSDIRAGGHISAPSASISGTITSQAIVNSSTIDCTGTIRGYGLVRSGTGFYSDGYLDVLTTGSFGQSLSAGGTITTGGQLVRTALAGGGTTGASINDNGSLIRTTSSQRYKTDIAPLSILYTDLIALEPKTFKRNEEVEESPETAKTYPGFIAEDLADTSLDVFVFRNAEGQPEGIHYAELSAALLSAIKTQHSMIENLTSRIEALENK